MKAGFDIATKTGFESILSKSAMWSQGEPANEGYHEMGQPSGAKKQSGLSGRSTRLLNRPATCRNA